MFKKYANAVVQDPILKFADWEKMHGRQAFGQKRADVSKLIENQTRYLLSHSTIMSSCQTELDKDWLIRETSSAFVNKNWDAWENSVLKMSYKSFIGAFNFEEHLQSTKAARGHIADAILRKVHIAPPDDYIYFVDLLVMTDCAHEELCDNIRSGKVKYMSMGCTVTEIQCSYCGIRVTDSDKVCYHLDYLKGTFLDDDEGTPRIICELCGNRDLPNGGVSFIEGSFVRDPAAGCAVVRNIVADEFLGPKTPYTSKSAGLLGINKVANVGSSIIESFLDEGFRY